MKYKQPPKVSITRPTDTAPRSSGGIGLLGAGANIVSGLVNNAFARKNAREQRAWQEKIWHLQNAYNAPSAMKERMLAAGLNPYQMTGAEPAGSTGTGATADTLPIADPLSAIRAVAEIKGINAQTSKTETESDKIIQETINLQIAERLGLVTAEEAELRMKDLRKLYGTDRSPVELSAQESEAGIAEKYASAEELASRISLNEAEARLANAHGKSEEDLLPYRISLAEKDLQVNEALRLLYGAERVSIAHESKREDALHPYRRAIMTLQERNFINANTGQDIMNKINSAISDWYTGDNPPSPGVLAEKIGSIVGDVLDTSIGFIFSPKKARNKPFNKRTTTKRTFPDSKNMTQTTDVEYY